MPSSDILDHIHVAVQEPHPRKQKRFQCPRCQRLFARLEHLQRHERTHTQERPFICNQCSSKFTRSDLLIRHERLSHRKGRGAIELQREDETGSHHAGHSPHAGAYKRLRVSSTGSNDLHHQDAQNASQSAVIGPTRAHDFGIGVSPFSTCQTPTDHLAADQGYNSPLATVSLAAEQTAFRDALAASSTPPSYINTVVSAHTFVDAATESETISASTEMVDARLAHMNGAVEESFDSFAFLEAEPMSSYHFTPFVTTEQPMPVFSPESVINSHQVGVNADEASEADTTRGQGTLEDLNSFSRFGSRLPSLQPDEHRLDNLSAGRSHPGRTERPPRSSSHTRRVSDVSMEDRQHMLHMISEFSTVIPDFQLPTRLSLARYIGAFINGFHEHLPFLHIPSMSINSCSVELLLAMAAVGAQYCFEAERGVDLFHAARAIATERIRRRDARIASDQQQHDSDYSLHSHSLTVAPGRRLSQNGPLGLPSEFETSAVRLKPEEDLMQSAQALLILMAMATWAKHKEILREALAIQSILASIVRDDGLRTPNTNEISGTWEEWVRCESVLRTKFIVFCFFNLHCIVYDIPPLILNSELKMRLPCSAAEFKADTSTSWEEARKKEGEPLQFQDALRGLFARGEKHASKWHSSLGNYILIHAIIQHIFFVRQAARCRFGAPPELTAEDMAPLEHALRNWQLGWKRNPESSLDPTDPNGPVAFNSTALLRLAYIRLNMDTGPGRALDTRDPFQIAETLRRTPTIRRTPKLVRALLHSAHALSIPIKIGIRLVARTQTFIWSIQHSLCSLECAFLLSKWLEAVSVLGPDAEPPVGEDERRILSIVKTMLDETEFAVPAGRSLDMPETARYLNAGVLRVWATIFKGAQTWAIVDVIGSSLNIYADMLEAT